jgi:hypothetical protein
MMKKTTALTASTWRVILMACLARATWNRPTLYSSRIDGLLMAD